MSARESVRDKMCDDSTSYRPVHLYGRLARNDVAGDVICRLQGNPDGMGISSIAYVNCIMSENRTNKRVTSVYNLKMTICWPSNGTVFDETQGVQKERRAYEDYSMSGYVGVVRKFKHGKGYILFQPRERIASIIDTDSDETVYRNDALAGDNPTDVLEAKVNKVTEYFFHATSSKEQVELNEAMVKHIGAEFINLRRDYFDVAEISRRMEVSPRKVTDNILPIVRRITVNKVSGCWAAHRGDYKTTFWLSKGGLSFNEVFHFPQDLMDGTPMVIKNRHILHSSMCEVTLVPSHSRCCRPQHLKLGTSRENAIHIKVRKSLDELLDLSPDMMQELAFHITCLSGIFQQQAYTYTRDELRVRKMRKGNRIMSCMDVHTGKKWMTVCGNPDMGDDGDITEESPLIGSDDEADDAENNDQASEDISDLDEKMKSLYAQMFL